MATKMVFLLVILAAVISAQGQPPRAKSPQPSPKILTVSLCDLMSKPADYDGKEIRVRATYNVGFEWAFFDTSCKEHVGENTPFWESDVVWAEFDESAKTATEPGVYEKFRKAEGFCCPEGWKTKHTELLVTGKFFKAGGGYGHGFGHEGRYAYKIVVDKVEEVGTTTMTSP